MKKRAERVNLSVTKRTSRLREQAPNLNKTQDFSPVKQKQVKYSSRAITALDTNLFKTSPDFYAPALKRPTPKNADMKKL